MAFEIPKTDWDQSSSKPWLRHIEVPTLVINAFNDPFMPPSALPGPDDVSPAVTLEFTEQGGHAGFLNSPFPGRLTWLPERIISFFGEQVIELHHNPQISLSELRIS